MKQCPECKRVYNDESFDYCLDDGELLLFGPALSEPATKLLAADPPETAAQTERLYSADPHSVPIVRRPNHSKLWLTSMLIVILVVGGLAAYRYWPIASKQVDSIAVLPFENNGGDLDTDYLSDGLTDSLMYRLSQLPNLAVTPRSTVFRYKGKGADPIQIGNDLGVSAVLSGRIVERADDLTVSVELVDIRRNKLLWGEQYNRKMSDLLATQREIAQEITEKLRLTVAGNDPGIAKHYTENNEAYQLYLKGRFYWEKRSGWASQKRSSTWTSRSKKTRHLHLPTPAWPIVMSFPQIRSRLTKQCLKPKRPRNEHWNLTKPLPKHTRHSPACSLHMSGIGPRPKRNSNVRSNSIRVTRRLINGMADI
jgi:Predicted integral membrane protein